MQLLLWAFLPSTVALFFDLGGGGGGCSCPSSCAAPPPSNFGCRLMCSGQAMSCQQQSFNQAFSQPNFAQPQPSYGFPAPAYPPYQNTYNNYQQQTAYARQPPQFTYPQQAQPQPVPAVPAFVPPPPSRYIDNYAASVNRIVPGAYGRNSGPIPPPGPPVYQPDHQATNPLPASFVSAVQPESSQGYATAELAHSQEVRLLPPEQPNNEAQPVGQLQGTNYVSKERISSYGKSASNEFSISISEKQSPEEIAKSIEDSYDEAEEELGQKEIPSAPKEEAKEIITNQVTFTILPNVNYVTTENTVPAIQTEVEEEDVEEPEEEKPSVKTTEYAIGNAGPVKAVAPTGSVTQYKTLTRGEGLSSENINQSGYDFKETKGPESTTPSIDEVAATEDYLAEEKSGEPAPEPSETTEPENKAESHPAKESGSNDVSSYNKKLRLPYDKNDGYETSTFENKPEKRSQTTEQSAFKCNSSKLRRIMEEKMTVSAPVSKQLIYAEATAAFPGLSLDVICSRHSFSYIVVTSPIYCEHRKSPLTCFAFFQP